jgi:membrane-associated phospholipid phosphatase
VSTVDGVGPARDAGTWLREREQNLRATLATLCRPPRPAGRRIAGPDAGRAALLAAASIGAVVGAMWLVDPWSVANIDRLPQRLVAAFDRLSDLGRSGWFLWPTGLALIAVALRDSPALPRFSRGVLAAWSVRLGFVFCAIAVPGLFVTIVKRLIGRARPLVEGYDVWAYHPFSWQVDYASLPSGHVTTAFSALVAIGALLPSTRALLWIYAVMIALSRVVVGAHHPSDVIAAAVVGSVGALLVRNWFAARRLGFVVRPDGTVQPLPGPSVRRILKAVAPRRQSA